LAEAEAPLIKFWSVKELTAVTTTVITIPTTNIGITTFLRLQHTRQLLHTYTSYMAKQGV